MREGRELEQALLAESERLLARRRELEEQRQAVQAELEDIVRRLGHVQALLGERSIANVAPIVELTRTEVAVEPANPRSDPVEIAYTILQERGGNALHYRELAQAVIERGGDLNGQDPAQTLVARLVRDDRFVRPSHRGWYALRAFYPRAKSVGKRKETGRKPVQKRAPRVGGRPRAISEGESS